MRLALRLLAGAGLPPSELLRYPRVFTHDPVRRGHRSPAALFCLRPVVDCRCHARSQLSRPLYPCTPPPNTHTHTRAQLDVLGPRLAYLAAYAPPLKRAGGRRALSTICSRSDEEFAAFVAHQDPEHYAEFKASVPDVPALGPLCLRRAWHAAGAGIACRLGGL